MRHQVVRTLLVGGTVAAAVALVTGQASAAATVTITGANTTFAASSTNPVFSDLTSGQSFRCTSASLGGSLADVTSVPLPFATTQADGTPHAITTLGFGGCVLSFGPITESAPGLPDDLVITATDTTAPQTSVFIGATGTALVHFSVGTCSFDVAGQADATWTNGTSDQLRFTGQGTLTVANASAGCFGLFNTGDVLAYTATYTVAPDTITITP